jgi:hypothetical protein
LVAVGFALCTILAARGASAVGLAKGTSELSGTAGFNSTSIEGLSVTNVEINAGYGYCFSSNWELMPTLALTSVSSGGETATSFAGAANIVYNFSTNGQAVPYLRGGLGFGTISSGGGSSLNVSAIPVLGGGVRVLVGNSASVNFGAFYVHQSWSSGGSSVSGNEFGLTVGLSIFPNGLK